MNKFKALNDIAINHLSKALQALDQRQKLEVLVVLDVLAEAFSQSHKKSIKILGQVNITDALVKAEILGRIDMRSNFFVKADWIDTQTTWETMENDPEYRSHALTKSKCYYRNEADTKTLKVEDVAGLGNGPYQYFEIVDFYESTGAFVENDTPSVRFLECKNEPDVETSESFMKVFKGACMANGVGMAELSKGLVVSDAHRALGVLNATTNRFFNSANKRFCVLTRDKYGREVKSYGQYY